MTAVEPLAEQPDTNRLAGGCVLAVTTAAAGGVVVTVPEAGYFVAGLMAAAAVRKARGWSASRRREPAEEQPEAEPADVVAILQQLGEGGHHVRLTQLQEAAGLPDTKAVRALLDKAGIPVRPGVRAGGKNGPGVHHDDVPAPLPADDSPSRGRCLCRSDANTNTNNEAPERAGEGLRVDPIGQAGTVITDPTETQRRRAAVTR